jgi:A/G-specific adenine glycosylase
MASLLAKRLLDWYRTEARELPWRGTRDPYRIWIAEIMLQQTRVETVIRYYQRWMARFPTLADLASADLEQVLLTWEGLGYYRRAHNLHRAAQTMVEKHDGRVPVEIGALEALPGIGAYTAAAIAAIAFDQPVLALDGNLRRVIARLLDLEEDIATRQAQKRMRAWGVEQLAQAQAGSFNQALMDLGATVCIPRAPRCGECPLNLACQSYVHGTQLERPVRTARKSIPHLHASAGILRRPGAVLLGRRPEGKLLGGLWEFPGGKQEPGESPQACLRRELEEELGIIIDVGASLGTYDHAYTHFKITVHAFEAEIRSGKVQALDHSEVAWAALDRLDEYPMGKVDRSIANRLVSFS